MFARSLRNPRLLVMLAALVLVAGLTALVSLPTAEDPRVMNRVATVLTPYPGATPERVEALVTEPLENVLRELPEVNVISSSSQAGVSVVRVELKDSITDTSRVWSEARDKIGDVQAELPAGALASRLDDDRGYAYTRLIALTWSGPGPADINVMGRYAEELAQRLRTVPGTDLVRTYGEPEEEIQVMLDPVAAARAGLSFADVGRAIESRDAKVSAGQLRAGDREWLLEVSGELDTLSALGNTVVFDQADGRALRLRNVAEIRRGSRQPPSDVALVNDKPAIVIGVRMLPEQRISLWSDAIQGRTGAFETALPANIGLELLFDQQRYTNDRLGGLVMNVLMGFCVILGVLFLTLGWRAALVVSFALPLTVAFTLAGMRWIELPIHQMSVTGLVVALGIMVDNAIVMADTIQRNLRSGLSRVDAVSGALRHLWAPLAGSTLTTVLAFMPIAIMPGPGGEFVGGIAFSVILALVGSYLVSFTLVAGLAGRFLQAEDTHGGIRMPALSQRFEALLRWTLDHPRQAIGVALVLPLLGFALAGRMPEQFFPPADRDMFTIEVHLDPAASLESTRRIVDDMDPFIAEQPGVDHVEWFLGQSAPSFYYNLIQRYDQRPNFGQAMVSAVDFEAANRLVPELQRRLDERYPEAQILVRKLEQGPPFNAPVELRVFGPDLDQLAEIGEQLRSTVLMTEDVIHARPTLTRGRPKISLQVDENQVRRAGLAPVDLAAQLQAALDGVQAGSIIEATEELPVRLRLDDDARQGPEDLYRLHLAGQGPGPAVSLDSLGTPTFVPAAGIISRRGGERVNTIEVYLRADVLPSIVQERIQERLAADGFTLPPGYRIEYGGETAERNSSVNNLLSSVGLILALLVTVVVLSFNSFRLSSIVFAVAALSGGLGLLCVWAFGYPFGFVVIVGLMGLVGLAINAAIVIMAELRADPAAARGEREPMIEGIMNCTRHIGSTTLTTLGGFMPLILGGGGFWPPFAIAIAGGTVLTSVLSFLLVPAAFRLYALKTPFNAAPGSPDVSADAPTADGGSGGPATPAGAAG
ncbi:MAG: efflux RND transporter permease subunit [Xanthomonadales bacterium]|jgi:multidrug efflux pump subunit AcrB|nr:efflux RND transporter permease subunit [Xanthomonadales bacterium]